MAERHVLVINQFAMPRTEWGLTRNADLFGRLTNWRVSIIAANRDHYAQRTFTTSDPLFRLVSVPAYRAGAAARLFGWAVFALKATVIGLTRRRVSVVYASSPQLLAAVAGCVIAKVRRRPFVLEIRDLWPESIVASGNLRRGSLMHRALEHLERFLYQQASRIVVVTAGWEAHFTDKGIDLSKLSVLTNGTDRGDLAVEATKEQLRREQGIEGFTAIYAGAHGPANGLDQLLDAASVLPDVHFLLVGAGAEKRALEQRARRDGLLNVTFKEPVPKRRLGDLLGACDVGLHVLAPWDLLTQGLSPNKLFDYMAAGLPVVSNCAEGLRDLVRDGECGRLGDYDEIARCLRDVRDAPEGQRVRWAERGQALIDQRFSRAAAADRLGRLLDDIVGSDVGPP